ncbi:MAG TPA: superoxide dismutase family protein [Vicinamibacteria bacterium]|jgi:Cu-Zn family superoxide dismutase|nr:superoxide dismutase family protein [Vicinamibacteria bacterium]
MRHIAGTLGLAAVFVAASAYAEATKAVAVLMPAKDGKAAGTLTFAKADGGVRITGRITGLNPGTHGFHVHEYGDCSAPDFASAGGHFNPTAQPHAGPKDAHRHAGDLGNVEAGADGSVSVDYTDADMRFDGDKSILGRAVVVHANADDLKTQPSGNAGGRVACGVIGVAKP